MSVTRLVPDPAVVVVVPEVDVMLVGRVDPMIEPLDKVYITPFEAVDRLAPAPTELVVLEGTVDPIIEPLDRVYITPFEAVERLTALGEVVEVGKLVPTVAPFKRV